MVSTHMLNKILLSKPLFQEILQFCSAIVILQILAKKPSMNLSKLAVSTSLSLKQFAVYYHCLFTNFEPLITTIEEL